MYTLDTNYLKKQSKIYFIISITVFIFGGIYEQFSHGINSAFMMYAFLIPLIFGSIFSKIMSVKFKEGPNRISVNLYNASIANFTVYFIVRGILEIYGTTNSLIKYYLITGVILLIISIIKMKK